jgi:hypothetical protein
MPVVLLTALKTAIGGAIGSILARTLTAKMAEDLLFWAAGIAVKHTKTPYDDELLAKLKAAKAEAESK